MAAKKAKGRKIWKTLKRAARRPIRAHSRGKRRLKRVRSLAAIMAKRKRFKPKKGKKKKKAKAKFKASKANALAKLILGRKSKPRVKRVTKKQPKKKKSLGNKHVHALALFARSKAAQARKLPRASAKAVALRKAAARAAAKLKKLRKSPRQMKAWHLRIFGRGKRANKAEVAK